MLTVSLEGSYLLALFVDFAIIAAGLTLGHWLMAKLLSALGKSSQAKGESR